MTSISLIAAINKTGGIGYQGSIPWRSAQDLAYFKAMTLHSVVIMGRKTFESLPKTLPDRISIVVSTTTSPQASDDVIFVKSYEEAEAVAQSLISSLPSQYTRIYVIGGVSAYKAFWDKAEYLYLTRVLIDTPQDVTLDLSDLPLNWDQVSQAKVEDSPPLVFEIYKRKSKH